MMRSLNRRQSRGPASPFGVCMRTEQRLTHNELLIFVLHSTDANGFMTKQVSDAKKDDRGMPNSYGALSGIETSRRNFMQKET